MKYVAAGSLADRLPPHPGPADRARVALVAQVCRAVHFAPRTADHLWAFVRA
jgi:hypothetical protein